MLRGQYQKEIFLKLNFLQITSLERHLKEEASTYSKHSRDFKLAASAQF